MSIYRTRNQGLAATLHYLLGPSAHRRTFTEQPRGVTFEFDDLSGEGPKISRTYHKDDGGTGFAVTDAKTLLDSFIEIRKTLSRAIENGGEWRNEQ
jgi:hypothetical protein